MEDSNPDLLRKFRRSSQSDKFLLNFHAMKPRKKQRVEKEGDEARQAVLIEKNKTAKKVVDIALPESSADEEENIDEFPELEEEDNGTSISGTMLI